MSSRAPESETAVYEPWVVAKVGGRAGASAAQVGMADFVVLPGDSALFFGDLACNCTQIQIGPVQDKKENLGADIVNMA